MKDTTIDFFDRRLNLNTIQALLYGTGSYADMAKPDSCCLFKSITPDLLELDPNEIRDLKKSEIKQKEKERLDLQKQKHYNEDNGAQSNKCFLNLFLGETGKPSSGFSEYLTEEHTAGLLMHYDNSDSLIKNLLENRLLTKNKCNHGIVCSFEEFTRRCQNQMEVWDQRNFKDVFLPFLSGTISESQLPKPRKIGRGYTNPENINYTLCEEETWALDKLKNMLELDQVQTIEEQASFLAWLILIATLHDHIKDYYKYNEVFGSKPYIDDITDTQYLGSYSKAMFLNNQEGKPEVFLSDVFQVPYVTVSMHSYTSAPSINGSSKDAFLKVFESFIENCYRNHSRDNCYRVMTIIGKPGSGKSSLIQFMLHDRDVLGILKKHLFLKIVVKRFAELDNTKINWDSADFGTYSLLTGCGLRENKDKKITPEQLENTLLILDGFDEIEMMSSRCDIINKITREINSNKNGIKNCAVIITCRDNYIETDDSGNVEIENYMRLHPLTQEQVKDFCRKYNDKMEEKPEYKYPIEVFDNEALFKETDENPEPLGNILGTPLILYMVIAEKVSLISAGTFNTITDVYDELFDPEKGVLNPSDPEWQKIEKLYSLRRTQIPVNKEVRKMSQLIASEMFHTSPDKAEITYKALSSIIDAGEERLLNYIKTVKEQANSQTRRRRRVEPVPIEDNISSGTLETRILGDTFLKFVKYIEGGINESTLCYVHRSIYEYFVASYIYDQLVVINLVLLSCLDTETDPLKDEKMLFALNTLRSIFQSRMLSDDIKNHLIQKLIREFAYVDSDDDSLITCSKIAPTEQWRTLFDYLLTNGFLYEENNASEDNTTPELLKADPAMAPIKSVAVYNVKQEISAFLNFVEVIRIIKRLSEDTRDNSEKDENCNYILLYSEKNEITFNQYVRMAIGEIQSELIAHRRDSENKEQGNTANQTPSKKADPILISNLDLSLLDMHGLNFKNMELFNINFDGSNLSGCDLSRCTFREVSLTGANLSEADLSNCSFRNLKVNSAGSGNAKTVFAGAELRGADLQKSAFADADFTGCHLEGCCAYSADLSNADFTGAFLDGADLVEAKFIGAHFNNASMIRANLEDADCTDADFTEAQLFDTKWNGAAVEEQSFDANGLDAVERGDGQF